MWFVADLLQAIDLQVSTSLMARTPRDPLALAADASATAALRFVARSADPRHGRQHRSTRFPSHATA